MEKQTKELIRDLAIDAVILGTLMAAGRTSPQAPKELEVPVPIEIERESTDSQYKSPNTDLFDPTDEIYVMANPNR
ncbi:MAG: hypothetical protein QF824_03395 [Candidatus Woesearchaeota archaeon]|jgi:hypothetical protein|nr:hypothetical protein [Candidatus Woesearchaeota archaeon]MDP7180288.1 hypothetical protein [Candidatus Woesearchaeota archaeon]